VTPSYNQGEFIRATIESVLSQDYPNLRYIVMDGGSTDQTAAIAAEYGSRLTWISEKDRGQAHAINKGFAMASGEIVAWLNSDDIFLPGAVKRAVRGFSSAPPGIGAIYGEGYLMDREGHFRRRFPHTEPFNLWKLMYLSDYVLPP
jgi:glycosyltransferase involved in cell wall biosynthesis